jgi:hypothetical protein
MLEVFRDVTIKATSGKSETSSRFSARHLLTTSHFGSLTLEAGPGLLWGVVANASYCGLTYRFLQPLNVCKLIHSHPITKPNSPPLQTAPLAPNTTTSHTRTTSYPSHSSSTMNSTRYYPPLMQDDCTYCSMPNARFVPGIHVVDGWGISSGRNVRIYPMIRICLPTIQ